MSAMMCKEGLVTDCCIVTNSQSGRGGIIGQMDTAREVRLARNSLAREAADHRGEGAALPPTAGVEGFAAFWLAVREGWW